MERLSCRAIAERLGIGKSLASELLAKPGAPEPSKFRSEASYLQKLCRAGVRAGMSDDRIVLCAAQAEEKKKKTQKKRSADPPVGVSIEDGPRTRRARAPRESSASDNVTTDDLEASSRVLRNIIEKIGDYIIGMLDAGDPATAMTFMDKFKHVQAEFRQCVEKLHKIRIENLELIPRNDAYAAAAQMFQVMRAFADSLVGDMVNIGNLAVWIEQAGGVFPEGRQAHEHVAGEIRSFVEKHYNSLADALGNCAVPVEDVQPHVSHACKLRMAEELESTAAELRRSVETGG